MPRVQPAYFPREPISPTPPPGLQPPPAQPASLGAVPPTRTRSGSAKRRAGRGSIRLARLPAGDFHRRAPPREIGRAIRPVYPSLGFLRRARSREGGARASWLREAGGAASARLGARPHGAEQSRGPRATAESYWPVQHKSRARDAEVRECESESYWQRRRAGATVT